MVFWRCNVCGEKFSSINELHEHLEKELEIVKEEAILAEERVGEVLKQLGELRYG